MTGLAQDLRYAVRQLRRSPGFTAVAVITLALGIGVNTAVFSMVDSFFLRPLPVEDPEQITVLAQLQRGGALAGRTAGLSIMLFSIADYRDLRSQTADVFSDLFAGQMGIDGLSVNGATNRIFSEYVTGNFFSALGIKPALGRLILPFEGETIGSDPVMVISYSYWKSHFSGDPQIVGRTVSVNGRPVTIVGIAPRGFGGLSNMLSIQAYLPLGMASTEGFTGDLMTNRQARSAFVYGRLRQHVSLGRAQAALDVAARRLAQQYPDVDKDRSLRLFPELHSRPNPDPSNTLPIASGLFLGLAAVVLLLACVNVANILLVRATVRAREMGIRAALGAMRARLVRQSLTETVLLAVIGSTTGVLIGCTGTWLLSSIRIQTDAPVTLDFGFDWRLFTFALLIALGTGMMVGVVPAIHSSRKDLTTTLQEAGRGVTLGRHRLREALVSAQVGGSLTLLVIAMLFARSLGKAKTMDLGFDPSNVLNFTMDPAEIGYNQEQDRAFYQNLLSRVRALPGVESAGTATTAPLGYLAPVDTLQIDGYQPPPGQPAFMVFYNAISPGYLQTMMVPVVLGRSIDDRDTETSPFVAIVNQAMVQRFWANQDPIGRRFRLGNEPDHSIEVIGVSKDARFESIIGDVGPYIFLPVAQHYASNSLATLQVRVSVPSQAMIPQVKRVIQSLAPSLPVFDVQTMTEALGTLNGFLLFQLGAGLAASLGLLGLILTIVGVYGVISYSTSQRIHEIGIRVAMGAQPMDILKMVFRQGLLIVSLGLAVGMATAFASARVLNSFLTISATDPVTYVCVAAALALVALCACYIPARRATKVDPMLALRHE